MTRHYLDVGSASDWSYRVGNLIQPIILMTRHYPDLGSASEWLNQISNAALTIQRSYRATLRLLQRCMGWLDPTA